MLRVGRHTVGRKVGSTGLLSTYDAEHDGTAVRLRVFMAGLQAKPEAIRRFQEDAALASRLGHPNIAGPVAFSVEDPVHVSTPSIRGASLADVCEAAPAKRLEPSIVMGLGADLADALSAAHAAGLVHAGLSPDAVLLGADGRAHITDFALARFVTSMSASHSQVMRGAIEYLAPEQVTASEPVGPATDVFSLGLLLYRAATSKEPFEAPSALGKSIRLAMGKVTPIESHGVAVPAAFAQLVTKMLSQRPSDRPAMSEIAGALMSMDELRGPWRETVRRLAEANAPAAPEAAEAPAAPAPELPTAAPSVASSSSTQATPPPPIAPAPSGPAPSAPAPSAPAPSAPAPSAPAPSAPAPSAPAPFAPAVPSAAPAWAPPAPAPSAAPAFAAGPAWAAPSAPAPASTAAPAWAGPSAPSSSASSPAAAPAWAAPPAQAPAWSPPSAAPARVAASPASFSGPPSTPPSFAGPPPPAPPFLPAPVEADSEGRSTLIDAPIEWEGELPDYLREHRPTEAVQSEAPAWPTSADVPGPLPKTVVMRDPRAEPAGPQPGPNPPAPAWQPAPNQPAQVWQPPAPLAPSPPLGPSARAPIQIPEWLIWAAVAAGALFFLVVSVVVLILLAG